MAMTAAERAKKYRDNKKKDPEEHKAYLQKERERYKKRKDNGEFNYATRGQREMNLLRRKWKIQKRNLKEKKTAENDRMRENTPERSHINGENQEHNNNIVRGNAVQMLRHQTLSGKKRKKRNLSKAYRKVKLLEKQATRYKAMWETSRKRVQRMSSKNTKSKLRAPKRMKMVNSQPISTITKIVRRIYKRTGHSAIWNVTMRRKIRQHMEEDINSSQAPGKNETITRGKVKMQKRYLNDTLLNLYKSFLEKHQDSKLSYASFCRFRPFWVVQKNVDSRDTCLCKVHENVKYRIQKLHRLKLITESNPDRVAESLVCDTNRRECAYKECRDCQTRKLEHGLTDDRSGDQVTFFQWVSRTEEIQTKAGTKTVTKTQKVVEQSTIETLVKETETLLRDKYLKHIFNIRHQYLQMKKLKENITEADAIVHVDFSENFNCKLSDEVQSMHFGGSRNQISLHTVVVYTKDKTESFCTISENTQHGPGAIWAHMEPILGNLKKTHPTVRRVSFVSDGPCTQYRSKLNFYLFHQEVLKTYGFEAATWNFTESGHGKSAADGVGGTVKRTADRLVANGIDIPDAKSFCKHVGEQLRNVKLYFVEDSDIERHCNSVPTGLQTVKGTMKLHQVSIRTEKMGILYLKTLSCFCKWPEQCTCNTLAETPEHRLPTSQISGPTLGDVPTAFGDAPTTPGDAPITLGDVPTNHPEDNNVRPHPELVGTWCIVKYEKQPYPGIIQDLDDESAEVRCMCRIGENRFFWPLVEDIIWYKWDDIMSIIPEPKHVTARHFQIEPGIWRDIKNRLL